MNHLHKFNKINESISESEIVDVFQDLIDDYNLHIGYRKLNLNDSFSTIFKQLDYNLEQVLKPYMKNPNYSHIASIHLQFDIYYIWLISDGKMISPNDFSLDSMKYSTEFRSKFVNSVSRLPSLFGGHVALVSISKERSDIIYVNEKTK